MQQVFISGDARKSDGKFGAEELTWKLLLPQRRRPWLPADELPRSRGRERKRETWMEARERGEVVKFYLAARALF